MKKLMLFAFSAALAVVAFAGMNTAELRVVPAVSPQSVTAGTAVTNDLAVSSMKGLGEILSTVGGATNTAATVTLYATNAVAGGWRLVNAATATGAVSVIRVPFFGQYLPRDLRVVVSAETANATASAVIITYR